MTIKLNIRHIFTALLAIALLSVMALSRLTPTNYAAQPLLQSATMQWHTDTCWGGWMTIKTNYQYNEKTYANQ